MRRFLLIAVAGLGIAAALYFTGHLPGAQQASTSKPKIEKTVAAPPPAVTVVTASPADFADTVLITGTLVPREEVLIAPEVEGLRVVEVLADEGMRVSAGQVLARLETATIDAQLAQNAATIARLDAGIAQAQSLIVQAEARVEESQNALARAEPLRKSGYLSESTFDTREAAARTAKALLVSSRDGLLVARAEKTQAEALRQDLQWRKSRTEIKSPVDGLISRRNARIGAVAAGAADPMYRVISKGEIELDAEVPEDQMARLEAGQRAQISIAGQGVVPGTVRLVSPEVDRSTRLGRVRILLDRLDEPRVGSFARGTVIAARSRGLSVPASAVLFNSEGPFVQVVVADVVQARAVKVGLRSDGSVEITSGLSDGDIVVAKAGTFLRSGDKVKPVMPASSKVSGVN